MSMQDFVAKTKQKYSNVRDIEFVAEAEDIKLFFINTPGNADGCAFACDSTIVIAINKKLTKYRQIEIFWHEYYHLHFSVGNSINNESLGFNSLLLETKDEKKADTFVALLLIDKLPEECDAFTIMEEFNVSQYIAEIRINYALSLAISRLEISS